MSDPAGVSVDDYRRETLAVLTEIAFQREIIAIAADLGWSTYHTHNSRGSDRGYPDLTCVHPLYGVAWFEVKRERHPSPFTIEQKVWIARLQAAGQVAAKVQPRDIAWVTAVLRGETREIPEQRRQEMPVGYS